MKNELLVIASYPPKGEIHGQPTVGVASYTKHTLTALSKNAAITVLAEKFSDEEEMYHEENILVRRLWKRNSLSLFPRLLWKIATEKNSPQNILIAFELAIFGNMLSLLPFPLFLFVLRFLGKNVTVVSHQVITDMREISGHINIAKNSFRISLLNILVHNFYRLLLLSSSKIIVFEDFFKHSLSRFGDAKKIAVIPHGVERFNSIPTKSEARSRLNIPQNTFIVLYFGYLAWYKGADWLVEKFPKQYNLSLIIAGGANPNHLNKAYYRQYISTIEEICKEKGIKLTGFVPQEQIPWYFQAADVAIFPYRTFMSSSGPLSMTFSFEKPFLISDVLAPLFEKQDIKGLTFSLDDNLAEKIDAFQHDSSLQKKAKKISTSLKKVRSWKNIGRLYYDVLFHA